MIDCRALLGAFRARNDNLLAMSSLPHYHYNKNHELSLVVFVCTQDVIPSETGKLLTLISGNEKNASKWHLATDPCIPANLKERKGVRTKIMESKVYVYISYLRRRARESYPPRRITF